MKLSISCPYSRSRIAPPGLYGYLGTSVQTKIRVRVQPVIRFSSSSTEEKPDCREIESTLSN
jgi:hypothetical protein